jgi:hypothetical protein
MLFLLNDRMLDLNLQRFDPPLDAGRFRALSLPYVIKLGQELFAEHPLLHREDQARACRLAALLALKAPEVNAALFSAPQAGCRPDEVATRFASLDLDVMAGLYARDREGGLTPVAADREVWRRMAA